MNQSNLSRRNFLKASALASVGASIAGVSHAALPLAPSRADKSLSNISVTRPRPTSHKPVHELTTKSLEKLRVAVIGLNRGMTHVESCLGIEFTEVVAVCDWRNERAVYAADVCEKKRGDQFKYLVSASLPSIIPTAASMPVKNIFAAT